MNPPVPIKKILIDHLDELSEVELQRFQWFLAQNKKEGCTKIFFHELKNTTTEGTVDKMVNVYGRDGVGEITVDVLMRIGQNDLSVRITEALIGPKVEQQLPQRETQRDADWATQDLSCSICKSIFTEPVTLLCGHSFCRICVHDHWKEKINRKCPICRKAKDACTEPQITFALMSLSESYRERSQEDPSRGHRNDSESYQSPTTNINGEKCEAFEMLRQFCDTSIEIIEKERRDTKQKIQDDFKKFHQDLWTEEAARIAALEEETTRRIRMMQLIKESSRQTFSLPDALQEMEDLQADPEFIQSFRTEVVWSRKDKELPDPLHLPVTHINVSHHLENLQHNVLMLMLDKVPTSNDDESLS